MADTTLETIDELLAGATTEVESEEARFRIRNARQLLAVIRQRHENIDEAIDDAVEDDELVATLQQLGYLD